jgi:HK97 family phage major capsid protein
MSKLLELYEKRNHAVTAARTFLDSKRGAGDILSAEDSAAYERMEADILALGREIERETRLSETEAALKQPTSVPLAGRPGEQPGADGTPKMGRASNEYKAAMLTALRSNFRKVENVLEVGTDANGGYLVPEEYDARLIEGLDEENILRKLGTAIRTSGEHKINIAGTKPAAAWIDEGGALTFGDATFAQITLDAHKLHVAVKVTEELLYDNAFNLENYILQQFVKALANAEEDAFLNGNGTGKPLGLLAATGGGQVGVTTASTTAIVADEVINLVYALKRPYRKSAAFIANDQTLAIIRKLKDNTGAYLWQPSLQAGEPDRLFGYPIHTSAFFPTVAAGAPALAFGDFSYYNIGDRGTRSFAELKELFAGNGMIGFVAKERVDGKLVLAESVQILKMKAA